MPLTDTYGQNIPYSTLTDVWNAQTLGAGIVNGLTPQSVMRFPSASVRGATIQTPQAGMVTYLKDVQQLQYFDGDTWQTVVASNLPWANVSLASGFQAYSGNTVGPRVRREGSIVYLEGRLSKTSGTIAANQNGLVLGTVPVGYRPVGHYAEGVVTATNGGTGAPLARIEIWHTDGTIRYWSDKATDWVGFQSWWFVN